MAIFEDTLIQGLKIQQIDTNEYWVKIKTNFLLDFDPTGHTITDQNKPGSLNYLDDGSSNAIVYFLGAHANSRIC